MKNDLETHNDYDNRYDIYRKYRKGGSNFYSKISDFFISLVENVLLFFLLCFLLIFLLFCHNSINGNLLKETEYNSKSLFSSFFIYLFVYLEHVYRIIIEWNSKLLNQFIILTFFSLFLSSIIFSSFSFSRGFTLGFNESNNFLKLERKNFILEKNFIKEDLMKNLENIQNKVSKLQYDFFDFSKKKDESASNFHYGVVEKKSISDVENIKKKVNDLEAVLKNLSSSFFEVLMNINNNNVKKIKHSSKNKRMENNDNNNK